MSQKNHEILGRSWKYNKSVPDTIAIRETLCSSPDVPDPVGRSYLIQEGLFFPALRHLGFSPISDELVQRECHRAMDRAVEYFTGSWWRVEEIDKLPSEMLVMLHLFKPIDRISPTREYHLDEISKGLDKSRKDRKLKWYDALTNALFFGGLLNRWDDLAKICSWFDGSIEPEYQAGTLEDEYMQLFVCIAGSLAPQLMPGAEELLAKVKKCRLKRPRLLCAAWEAAIAVDQPAFDKAFKDTVNHFLSKPDGGQLYNWVAIHQSAVLFIAEHRGLKCPMLSEKQQAAVVTRQSAGIAE
ncbi:MAG: hypothetical protein V4719_21620 [Planctomycetota bacterium]